MTGSLHFRVLGPLEVSRNGRPLRVAPGKERSLLAILVLHRNETVPITELLDELWDGAPPRTAQTALHGYVAKLRKVVGTERLTTSGSGYLLRVDADELDADRFELLLSEGRTSEALALWRGPALSDVRDDPFAQDEIGRLNDLHLVARERALEAMVENGRADEVVSELEILVREQPYRERLRSLLMLALYRAGRQAEALEAYREMRSAFIDELGIEPSADVRQLEQRMLAQDPALVLQAPNGVAPPPAAPTREERKVVTVVHCDFVGADSLGHRVDTEELTLLMERYVDACTEVFERHGGVIAGISGGAVIGTFGIPRALEDDALRALRAAADIADALEPLGLEARVGVATGELVVGGRLAMPLGEAVNVAARLRERAQAGGVVFDDATHARCGEAVTAHRVTLHLEGKPVDAYSLSSSPDLASPRRLDVPLVGRESELLDLEESFERMITRRTPCVVTVIGAPGLGKTRLALEFAAGIGSRARVLTGHCVGYGDDVAHGPLKELIVDALGAEQLREHSEEILAGEPDGATAASALLTAAGLADEAATQQETRWAFRRVIRRLSATTPVVLVIEDAHWSDDAFLDLLEHLVDFSADVPLMVLLLARPEFADERASWLGRRQNAASLRLEPLSAAEARAHVDHLGQDVDVKLRARVVEVAEGNPLFAEQLLSHAVESGGRVEAPATIEALLAARIDGLGAAEREVLGAAAVIGDEFTLSAAQALLPPDLVEASPQAVAALVRRDLVRTAGSESIDAFRFSHALVREAAYAGLLKRTRVELHERFADWLEHRPLGQEELIGNQLELAHRALREVGGDAARIEALAARAAEWLGVSGSSALRRGDFVTAEAMATRALRLAGPGDRQRPDFVLVLGRALVGQRRQLEAQDAFRNAAETAERLGDTAARRQAELYVLQQRLYLEPALGLDDLDELEAIARADAEAFEAAGDDRGACVAWLAVHNVFYLQGRYGDAIEAVLHAISHARESDLLEARLRTRPMLLHVYGPTSSSAGIAQAERLLADDVGLAGTADALAYGGVFHAMRREVGVGRAWVGRSQALWREAGADGGGWFGEESMVNVLAEDWPAAESSLRAQCELLDNPSQGPTFETYASALAHVLVEVGQDAEAHDWVAESKRRAAAFDRGVQCAWRSARARLLARRGSFTEAEALARESVAIAAGSDDLWASGDAQLRLSEVLALTGQTDGAVSSATGALEHYEKKQHLVGVARARDALARLRSAG